MPFRFDPNQPTKHEKWTNFSGSIGEHAIADYFTVPGDPREPGALEKHASAVREIIDYCFAKPNERQLRAIGSTWSFSNVIFPGQVMINPGNMYSIYDVPAEHWTGPYADRAKQGFKPMFVEGGAGIGTLNDVLGERDKLALQTSGAGDGHLMAGCIATGTHGSAINIGALHDTVLAMHLIVSPDQALLVQSGSNPPFHDSVAAWLQKFTGIPTRVVADDTAIAAAKVALGSLGFVFGVIVEATNLYCFDIRRTKHRPHDPAVMNAIRTLDTSALQPPDCPDRPYHFEVIMDPYPPNGAKSWFVTMMWKRAVVTPFQSPRQGIARATVDTMRFIKGITDLFAQGFPGTLTRAIVQGKVFDQLDHDASTARQLLFPGQVFGPTTLPQGNGASTEIVVSLAQSELAIETILETIESQSSPGIGNLLLGCVAVRFVPKTRSLLGMNQFDMNCFIELPSIRSKRVLALYHAVWDALEAKHINFACHWGQLGGHTADRTARYYGQHANDWKVARRKLLTDDAAMQVFASKILTDAGLSG